MKIGHFQPFVSLRVTAIVDMHWGAKTNPARNPRARSEAAICAADFVQVGSSFLRPRANRSNKPSRSRSPRLRGQPSRKKCKADIVIEPDRLHHLFDTACDMPGNRNFAWTLARSCRGDRRQGPKDNRRSKNDRSSAFQKNLGSAQNSDRDILERRPLIFGKLHHEASPPPLSIPRRRTNAAKRAPAMPRRYRPNITTP